MLDRESKYHAWRYYYVDGLVELAVGALHLVLALVFVFRLLGIPVQWMFHVLMFPIIPLMFFGIERLRGRLTYPRTGYVMPHAPKRAKLKLVALFLLISAALNALVFSLDAVAPDFLKTNNVLLQGLLTGVGFAAVGFAVRRMQLLGMFVVLLGAFVTLLPLSSDGRYLMFCAVLGSVLLTSGLAVLRRYLKRTAPGERQ